MTRPPNWTLVGLFAVTGMVLFVVAITHQVLGPAVFAGFVAGLLVGAAITEALP